MANMDMHIRPLKLSAAQMLVPEANVQRVCSQIESSYCSKRDPD